MHLSLPATPVKVDKRCDKLPSIACRQLINLLESRVSFCRLLNKQLGVTHHFESDWYTATGKNLYLPYWRQPSLLNAMAPAWPLTYKLMQFRIASSVTSSSLDKPFFKNELNDAREESPLPRTSRRSLKEESCWIGAGLCSIGLDTLLFRHEKFALV